MSIFSRIFPVGRFLHVVGKVLPLTLLVASILISPTAHAAGGTASFSLQPTVYDPNNTLTQTYFILNLSPGTTMTLGVRVTNVGTASGSVNLYPVDATTGVTTGTIFGGKSDPRRDVGTWIHLDSTPLILAPGQSKIVPFQLVIPRVVRPGQHLGGIIAEGQGLQTQTATTTNKHFQLTVHYLFALAVQVNLPGPAIEQLTATGIQAGGANTYQTLQLALHNTGTMMIKGSGSLQVRDTHNVLLQNLPVNLGIFLPATSIHYPVNVQKHALGPGEYQATLNLTYGHGHILRYVTMFTISQQQVTQAFPQNVPLQYPEGANFLSTMPVWEIILIGLLVLSGAAFLGQNLYRFTIVVRRKSKNGK